MMLSTTTPPTTTWDPTSHLAQRGPSALLILNRPINDAQLFERLWRHSTFRICADGGANRLFDFDTRAADSGNDESKTSSREHIPDEICGDLDSIRADVRDEYAKLGVTITRLASQSETDFGKCVSRIGMYYDSQQQQQRCSTTTNHEGSHRGSADEPFDILVLGGLGGRIDQAFSILHRLYNPPERPTWIHGRIFLFSEENVSWVLNPGRNVVVVARRRRRAYLGVNVGIIPIGCPAVISTKGLEWDVAGWRTEFGEQVSTSNHLMAGEEGGDGDDDVLVEIVTDKCVLFTVERAPMMPGCECCLSEVVV